VLTSIGNAGRANDLDSVVYQLKPFTPQDLKRAIAQADEPISERMRASLIPVGRSDHARVPLSILVAEDNPTNQLVVTAMLERLGHHVEVVENGELAVRTALQKRFDVVLMDLQMPVMGGLEATRLIRESEMGGSRHLPIVALTAQVMSGDRLACKRAGMDEFLSKPLELAALNLVLANYSPIPSSLLPPPLSRDRVGAGSHETCIDFAAFYGRIGDDPEIILKLVALFERDWAMHLDELQQQVRVARAPQSSAAAHTIKGMLRNICAAQAADLAVNLEKSIVVGDWLQAEQHLGDLQSLVDRVVLELKSAAQSR